MLRIREREGGITTLHRKFFCLNTEKLRRGNLCFRKVLVSQNFMDERGGREFHDFMLENFSLTVPKIFVEEPICVAENFWYREKSRRSEREREREGHHDFPSKICCLTVPSNFVGETCVSENFWYRKMLRIRERGGHHDFLSKIRCLTVPKNFVGETCVSERFWYRKIFWMRRGAREYHDFQMEIFCLTEPKNFVQEPFCVAENFWYRKISRREREGGASRLSLKNLLSHRTEQLRRGNLCYRKFLVSKNVKDMRERGGITTFHRKFVVSQYRKTS